MFQFVQAIERTPVWTAQYLLNKLAASTPIPRVILNARRRSQEFKPDPFGTEWPFLIDDWWENW